MTVADEIEGNGLGLWCWAFNYFGFSRNSPSLHFSPISLSTYVVGLGFRAQVRNHQRHQIDGELVFSVTFHTTPTMRSPNNACMRLGLALMACPLGELKSTISIVVLFHA